MPIITIDKPTIELGENRYLHHYIYEVMVDRVLAGHIFATRYNYHLASEDKVLYRWLCQRDSYTEHNADLMMESSSQFAELPHHLEEITPQEKGFMILVDEVTFSPSYRGQGLEVEALRKLTDSWMSEADIVLVPDFAPMARYINGIKTNPVEFWSSAGFALDESQTMLMTDAIQKGRKIHEA